MINKLSITGLSAMYVVSSWIVVSANPVNMPMRLTPAANHIEILKSYPLGTMNKIAVLSHHGKADKEIQLPNKKEGWSYNMGIHRTPKSYATLKKHRVRS